MADDWLSPETMPHGITVEVRTVKGLIRTARRVYGEGVRRARGAIPASVHCWKRPGSGDLYAVAWRPVSTQHRGIVRANQRRWWVDHAGTAWINTRLTMDNPLSPEEIEQMTREADEIVRLAAGVN